jgi:hypothetical protein
VLIILALAFFFACVLYVMKKRLFWRWLWFKLNFIFSFDKYI